jgi:hypothetical protein
MRTASRWDTLTLRRLMETLRPLKKPMLYIHATSLHDRSFRRAWALRQLGLFFAVQGDLRSIRLKMTRLGAVVTLALVWAVSAGAQSTPSNPPETLPQSNPPTTNSTNSSSLPNGTGIVGTLSTKLDTKYSKVGDRVEVEVTQDVKPAGQILLRRGSHVTGQVTQLYAFSKGNSNAKLEIVFNNIVSKSGEQIPAHLAIYALAAKSDPTKDDVQDGRGLAATSTKAGVNGGLGRPANGMLLKPDTQGVIGLDWLKLAPLAKDNPPTSLVHSDSKNIHLDKGTEIVLVVVGP